MRIVHALVLLLFALIAPALLAGCGGGGGDPTDTEGTVTVNDAARTVTFTPPTNRTTVNVFAYFDKVGYTGDDGDLSKQPYAFFTNDPLTGKWNLDYSDSSGAFSTSAIGDYDMSVWVVYSDAPSTPVRVGPIFRLTDLYIIGSGPPPTPF